MAAGDMADGEGHGQHRQAEGQRDADETDAQFGIGRGQHGRAASAQHQPGRSDEFRNKLTSHAHTPVLIPPGTRLGPSGHQVMTPRPPKMWPIVSKSGFRVPARDNPFKKRLAGQD